MNPTFDPANYHRLAQAAQPGEILLTNSYRTDTTLHTRAAATWQTLRVDRRAYETDGSPHPGLVALYVQADEVRVRARAFPDLLGPILTRAGIPPPG